MTEPASWTEHTSSSGRTFYYDRVSGVSAWSKPETSVPAPKRRAEPLSLMACLDQPAVLGLARAIVRHCGVAALPTVATKPSTDPFCDGGRGGAFCCASKSIYLCEHAWVGCREVAYELSHALNACRGTVRCAPHGVQFRMLNTLRSQGSSPSTRDNNVPSSSVHGALLCVPSSNSPYGADASSTSKQPLPRASLAALASAPRIP